MRGKCKTMTRQSRAFFTVIAMCAAISLPTAAYAFDWYGGASFGKNRYQVTGGDFFINQTFSGSVDGNDNAWKAFIGMQLFEKYVSAEFGYIDLGTTSAKGTVSGAPVTATSKTKAYTASLVGLIPMGGRFDMLVRLGMAAPKAHVATTNAGVGSSQNSSDIKIFGGLGAQFDITKKTSVRIEYERFNQGSVGPTYANVLSAGFTYLFYTE
ncbi:MAG: outer membrane beta-barrel protein [Sulfuricaulis sp.]